MDNNQNRILGRILAVEEAHDVSGARPASPIPTFPPTDTGEWQDIIPMDTPYAAI